MHISESKPSPLLDLDPGSTSLVLDKRRGSVRPSTFPIKTSEPTASLGSNSVDDIDISKAPKIKLKLIMLGNTTVGKTTLLHRYCNGDWSNAATTCGIDLRLKRVKVNETWVKLSIWVSLFVYLLSNALLTLAVDRIRLGKSVFNRSPLSITESRTASFLVGDVVMSSRWVTHASFFLVVVYDVGNRSSFSNLAKWFSNLEEKLPSKDYARIPKILVANKIDGVGLPCHLKLCLELKMVPFFVTETRGHV